MPASESRLPDALIRRLIGILVIAIGAQYLLVQPSLITPGASAGPGAGLRAARWVGENGVLAMRLALNRTAEAALMASTPCR